MSKSNRRPVAVEVGDGVGVGDGLLLLSLLLILSSLFLVLEERVATEVIIVLESELVSNDKGRAQPNVSLILPTLPPLTSSPPPQLLLLLLELFEVFFNNMGTTATSGSNE